MKKILLPLILALVGLGAGVGAGIALKPAPPEEEDVAEIDCETAPEGTEGCAPKEPDPFKPVEVAKPEPEGETVTLPVEKPFVVPVFRDERVQAMIVASVAIVVDLPSGPVVEPLQARLRDAFLAAMFLHSNSGGFDGTYTEGRKMSDLKAALLNAAQSVLGEVPVYDVLITDIIRQDV